MPIIYSKDLRLQTLRIPAQFSIQWNEFYDILNNGEGIFFEDYPDTLPYELYKNTLFQVKHKYAEILVDLGWYPEHEPTGEFGITVLRGDDKHWEHPLYEFSSRNKDEIVDKLNELMADVASGKMK